MLAKLGPADSLGFGFSSIEVLGNTLLMSVARALIFIGGSGYGGFCTGMDSLPPLYKGVSTGSSFEDSSISARDGDAFTICTFIKSVSATASHSSYPPTGQSTSRPETILFRLVTFPRFSFLRSEISGLTVSSFAREFPLKGETSTGSGRSISLLE